MPQMQKIHSISNVRVLTGSAIIKKTNHCKKQRIPWRSVEFLSVLKQALNLKACRHINTGHVTASGLEASAE